MGRQTRYMRIPYTPEGRLRRDRPSPEGRIRFPTVIPTVAF
jgi:hypothetical protein